MQNKKIKCKAKCPICGNYNSHFLWYENHSDDPEYYSDVPSHRIGTPNGYYLCHYCGFYAKEYDNRYPDEKISFDPKIIPLKRQLKIIRKNYKKLEGMRIGDHCDSRFRDLKNDSIPWDISPTED